MQVERQQAGPLGLVLASGARVRNAYTTCLVLGDSPPKGGLIPHNIHISHGM